ncbi:MAG: transcription termination factor NusA, partial [Salinispira sp.]
IQSIVRELEGEKIDILKFATDPRELIQNALSPAVVSQVVIVDEIKKHALAIVEEDQLSLAIGKQGLNVRLANRLVDWNIDVKTEEQFEEMDITIAKKQAVNELFSDDEVEITRISELPNISPRLVAILTRDNIEYIEDLISLDQDEMKQLANITEDDVAYIQKLIKDSLIVEDGSPAEAENTEAEAQAAENTEDGGNTEAKDADGDKGEGDKKALPSEDEPTKESAPEDEAEDEITFVSELPDIPERIVTVLKAEGIVEIIDLLNMNDDELRKISNLEDEDITVIQDIIKNTIEVIEEDE